MAPRVFGSPAFDATHSPASITTTFNTGVFTGASLLPAWEPVLRLIVTRLRQLPRAEGIRVALGLLTTGKGRGVRRRSRGYVSISEVPAGGRLAGAMSEARKTRHHATSNLNY